MSHVILKCNAFKFQIMYKYTNAEMADIHFTYGRANGNSQEAVRLYRETYPARHCPAKGTFAAIHRRLGETGSFAKVSFDCGANRTVRNDVENDILEIVDADPSTSTRRIAADVGISSKTVWNVLHEQLLYPFHVQKVQALSDDDFLPRLQFCRWFLEQCNNDPNFHNSVLFTDECSFSRDGIMNTRNNHRWSHENPHEIAHTRHQQRFSYNVWAGIVDNYLLGPVFLPPRLNGQYYRQFLDEELEALLDEVPLQIRQNLWFMQDGAPAHFSVAVRDFLNTRFPNHWIGRAGPIAWPPRSPDCNPCDFFLWGHLKDIVYQTPIENAQVLRQRIEHGFHSINETPGIFRRVRQSMIRRSEACVIAQGGYFEQSLK